MDIFLDSGQKGIPIHFSVHCTRVFFEVNHVNQGCHLAVLTAKFLHSGRFSKLLPVEN